MAYACDYCLKSVDRGHLVSHAKNRVNTLRKPNLHRAFVLENGVKVRRNLCTKCLRSADRPHLVQLAKAKAAAPLLVKGGRERGF
jgi:large subunit ribosomal protein L28